MHKCVRCGRAATSIEEINAGCPCGSKVFVFNKDALSSIAGEDTAPKNNSETLEGGDGKVPESYHARMTFTSEDVENIKVVTEGVFMLELHSLYRDPVVLKDEEGVYYVKIPIEQNKDIFGRIGGNGKGTNGKERPGNGSKKEGGSADGGANGEK